MGGAPAPSIALSNLRIDPNPYMSTSCFVSWTTEAPASSEVQFGEQDYELRIRDLAPVTEHRVLVIGMHADTDYRIKAISANPDGAGRAVGRFTTGSLPDNIALPDLTISNVAKSQPGWTLINLDDGGDPERIVMYDEDAQPVWYFIHDGGGARADVVAEFIGDSVLVSPAPGVPAREVDLSGKIAWEGPPHEPPAAQSHELRKTSMGNYLLHIDSRVVVEGIPWVDAVAQEIKPDHSTLWSWSLFDHLPPAGTRGDLCHGNAMTLDEVADVLYYNCRYLGVFKIDRGSGNIVWRLGGTFDTTTYGPGDFTFDPVESQFSDAHDPEFHADGSVLLYDNGGFFNLPSGPYHSRVVEYQLDQDARTAIRTFEFPGEFAVDSWYKNDWYTPAWGDADRLDNGNVLVTAGMASATNPTRVFEVTRTGEVVWEMVFPPYFAAYRAQRISPPPLVERLP